MPAIKFASCASTYVKLGLWCSTARGCYSDSNHFENTVSLKNQEEENMPDGSSE